MDINKLLEMTKNLESKKKGKKEAEFGSMVIPIAWSALRSPKDVSWSKMKF